MTTIHSLAELPGERHANVFPDAEPRTIRLSLPEGEKIPAHRHPGRDIIFYVVEGLITLQLGETSYEIAEGDIARFSGEQEISPHALKDSIVLIILAQRSDC